jgi:hypothetical protein
MRARHVLLGLWAVVALGWMGFIVGTRFRIGDGYATGFSLIDLALVLGPPAVLLLIGGFVTMGLRSLFR